MFFSVLKMGFGGLKTSKNILLLLVLLGFLTALWRSCGTIAYIISLATPLIFAKSFILVCFLLNCVVSTLSGTAFGTAATVGSICILISASFEISEIWTGGAVLSGVYFGNRISPISSIALLTSSVTKTDIYSNIKKMISSTILPFSFSCGIYFFAGIFLESTQNQNNVQNIFELIFNLNILCLIPAFVIIICSIFKIKIAFTLLLSIFSAFLISLFVQKFTVSELFDFMIFGFKTKNPNFQKIIGGGGFFSIFRVLIIVFIVSFLGGIIRKTKILNFVKTKIENCSKKTNSYFATLLTSLLLSMIVCNQTLTIILTSELCDSVFLESEKEKFSLSLFNSAVIIAPLIPWSVASGTVLASINAPTQSILCACFLYLLPILSLLKFTKL